LLLLGRSTGELRGHELEVDDTDSVKDNVSSVTSLAADISKITLSFTTLLPFWLYGTYL
jgi:hypothetical protein